jgi:hypothetical protein
MPSEGFADGTFSQTPRLILYANRFPVFLNKCQTVLCQQYGRAQKECVEVPHALLKKTSELKKYVDSSFAFASSLKPKPGKQAQQ